jgi:hypothetical protein
MVIAVARAIRDDEGWVLTTENQAAATEHKDRSSQFSQPTRECRTVHGTPAQIVQGVWLCSSRP